MLSARWDRDAIHTGLVAFSGMAMDAERRLESKTIEASAHSVFDIFGAVLACVAERGSNALLGLQETEWQ